MSPHGCSQSPSWGTKISTRACHQPQGGQAHAVLRTCAQKPPGQPPGEGQALAGPIMYYGNWGPEGRSCLGTGPGRAGTWCRTWGPPVTRAGQAPPKATYFHAHRGQEWWFGYKWPPPSCSRLQENQICKLPENKGAILGEERGWGMPGALVLCTTRR